MIAANITALIVATTSSAPAAEPPPWRWEGEHWREQRGSWGPDLSPYGSQGACLGSGLGGARGHFVLYRVRLPEALAHATLYLRYARLPAEPAGWELSVDGGPAQTVTFPSTGGWGHRADAEWRFLAVALGDLSPGWHAIELRSLQDKGNTNFDCLVLAPADQDLPTTREAIERLPGLEVDRGPVAGLVDESLDLATFCPVVEDVHYPPEAAGERAASPPPQFVSMTGERVRLRAPDGRQEQVLEPGQEAWGWMLVGLTRRPRGAVLEQCARRWGRFLVLGPGGLSVELGKPVGDLAGVASAPQGYPPAYMDAILASGPDLLGERVLAGGDPSYERVAGFLPGVQGYTPVCAAAQKDKPVADPEGTVGLLTGGYGSERIQDPWFDPRAEFPDLHPTAATRGLLGGYLPVVDFGFHDPARRDGWEQIVFSTDEAGGRTYLGLKAAGRWRFFVLDDGRSEIGAGEFFEVLLEVKQRCERGLREGLRAELPEPRLADACRAALLWTWATYAGDRPKYGLGSYAGAQHDGFPPTTLWMATACAEWGLFEPAKRYLGRYLDHFVRPDGTFDYYGPAVSEYGQMLEAAARLYRYTRDDAGLQAHLGALQAIADHLLELGRAAREGSRPGDPAYGLLFGSPEADTREQVNHYFSGTAWAYRGLLEFSRVLGARPEQAERAASLRAAAEGLRGDLIAAAGRALLPGDPPFLPPFPGLTAPFATMTADSLASYTNYRYWPETLAAGVGDPALTAAMIGYRRRRGGELLGMTRFARQLDDWPFAQYARALLEEDDVGHYLLGLYGHLAHHQTRGTFTAYEQVSILDVHRRRYLADYCVPSQLTVPILVRWMLAYEERDAERLWLAKAVPRRWWEADQRWAVSRVPTRWGPAALRVETDGRGARITVERPGGPEVVLRIRCPEGRSLEAVEADGEAVRVDAARELVVLPAGAGELSIVARY